MLQMVFNLFYYLKDTYIFNNKCITTHVKNSAGINNNAMRLQMDKNLNYMFLQFSDIH